MTHPDMPVGQHCQNDACPGRARTLGGRAAHVASVLWDNGIGWMVASRPYMGSWWCECCAVRAQVEHARERVKELANLEQKLRDLEAPTSAHACI